MSAGHEKESRASASPPPQQALAVGDGRPRAPADVAPATSEAVLRWIGESAPRPWFPSVFSAITGVPRDSLDEPLAELRLAELTRVSDWVRGVGQGYSLTQAGEACVKDPTILAKLSAGPPTLPPPVLTGGPVAALAGNRPRNVAEPAPASTPGDRPVQLDLRPPIVTPALLIANIIWFTVGIVYALRWNVPLSRLLTHGNEAILLRLGAVNASTLYRGEWWRLLTCCFNHFGLIHLLCNLFALGMTGSLAEVLWGRWRLALIYLLSGLAGSCLAMALHPDVEGRQVELVGASGAIWGILASLAAWIMLYHDHLPPALVKDWSRRLMLMLVLNIGLSLLPGISWECHLGGGMAGFVAAGLVNALRAGEAKRRYLALVLLLLFPFGCLTGLALAMKYAESWAGMRGFEARIAAQVRRAQERDLYNKDVRPMLNALNPKDIGTVDRGVVRYHAPMVRLLTFRRQQRDPETRVALKKEIARLEGIATETVQFLEGHGADDPSANPHLKQSLGYARATRDLLDQLRKILEAPGLPDMPAWQALRERRAAWAKWVEGLFVVPPRPPADAG